MRTVFRNLLAAATLSLGGSVLGAEEALDERIQESCQTELGTYCDDVSFGEGRSLGCLFAHHEKLSGQCEYALYEAAVQLERAVAAFTDVAKACDDDMNRFCAHVQAGEGRLIECLEGKAAEVTPTCKAALTTVGVTN
jgi:hypothetical protein